MARRGPGPLASSPFVVMSDVTIALSFILIVFGITSTIATSQALAAAQRDRKQQSFVTDAVDVLKSFAPQSRVVPGVSGERRIESASGELLAQVWVNGNFVRVSPAYSFWVQGKPEFNASEGPRLYRMLGELIQDRVGEVLYVYTHGISEVSEMEALAIQGDVEGFASDLSRERADVVFSLLQSSGVISPDKLPEADQSRSGAPMIPRKFAISYGTGTVLYRMKVKSGRVDLVLFFKDAEEAGSSEEEQADVERDK